MFAKRVTIVKRWWKASTPGKVNKCKSPATQAGLVINLFAKNLFFEWADCLNSTIGIVEKLSNFHTAQMSLTAR